MIEIYATVGGVLQCTFPRVLSADSCDKLAILLFRLQALRKVLYGIRKQRSEILFPSLLRRPKESYPCLNPIVSASPPCCASKGSIPFGFQPHKPAPKCYNIPPEVRHNFVQYIPPQWLAICRRVW